MFALPLRFSICLAALFVIGASSTAQAQMPSLMNPYRSYNLSGINYGSQQWERDHAKQQGQQHVVPMQQQQQRLFVRRRHRR